MGPPDLAGCTILVAKDNFFIAMETADQVRAAGGKVLGPIPSVRAAMPLLGAGKVPDGAVLDIKLADVEVYPLADCLMERGIPMVFASSYAQDFIPQTVRGGCRCSSSLLMSRPRLLPCFGRD